MIIHINLQNITSCFEMPNTFKSAIGIGLLVLNLKILNAQQPVTYEIPDSLNTAKAVSYLTFEEKQVIRFINYVRAHPQQFLKQYLNPERVDTSNLYVKSLLHELRSIKPLACIYPNRKLHRIAQNWAKQAGKRNVTGHQGFSKRARQFSKSKSFSECCSYGYNTGLDIVLQLLIDDGVKNLGHRKCLLSNHNLVGVSIQSHRGYLYNAVLDFSNK